MKFYGKGIVWDKRNNKPLCRFANGELETKDIYTIQTLISLNFKHTGEIEIKKSEEKNEKVLTVAELKKIAKNKGIKGYQKMKKAELLEVTK